MKSIKSLKSVEKIITAVAVCVFSYAMLSLFMEFASYIGRNGF